MPKPQPSRPHTPWSPEANRMLRPCTPAFWKAVLHENMYSVLVCCFSSLPYETECTKEDVALLLMLLAQLRSEYSAEYTTVRGISGDTDLMYSMSSSASTPAPGLLPPMTVSTSTL